MPLAFMAVYIILGFRRGPEDVSDERFGDSCYYLGFIFTISSIAFSLFDIPDLDKAGRLTAVAVRFGAAMISTFLGFIVRVYLVGFHHESTEAIQSLENQVVESANRLKTRLDLSQEAFEAFEEKVRQAANDTETRVRIATENVGRHLSQEMAQTLKAIAAEVQALHKSAADQMNVAALALSADLSKCSQALVADISRAQAHFIGMADQLQTRLRAVTFPDDFFTKELTPPVRNLVASMVAVGDDLNSLKESVNISIEGLSGALAKIEAAMETPQSVRELVQRQEAVSKQVLEVVLLAGRAIDSSSLAIKEQNSALTRLSGEFSAAQSSQTQIVASTQQIAQDLAGAQKAHLQVIGDLGRLIKQLEQLPAELRKHLVLLPTPTNIAPSPPQPFRSDATGKPPISPLIQSSGVPIQTSNPGATQGAPSLRDRPEHSKPSFWDNVFGRRKE